MTEKVTLEDVGITREEVEVFFNQLIDLGGGVDMTELQMMHLYIKSKTSTALLAEIMGIEDVQVTLGEDVE